MPRVSYDINAEIQRRHKTDFITMRNGSRADLRTWHPEKNAFVYTKLGKEFFEKRPRQYIISIPSRIRIKRRDGKTYEMFGHYPATDLSDEIRRLLDAGIAGDGEEARRQAAKTMILQEQAAQQNSMSGAEGGRVPRYMPVREDYGNLVLAEFSDQTIYYDPAGEWQYSMMEVSGFDDGPYGRPSTTAVMDRPLNGFRWPCKDTHNVMPEAYQEDGVNCVVRQLCAL